MPSGSAAASEPGVLSSGRTARKQPAAEHDAEPDHEGKRDHVPERLLRRGLHRARTGLASCFRPGDLPGDLTFDDLPAAVDAAKEGDAILVADLAELEDRLDLVEPEPDLSSLFLDRTESLRLSRSSCLFSSLAAAIKSA